MVPVELVWKTNMLETVPHKELVSHVTGARLGWDRSNPESQSKQVLALAVVPSPWGQ